MPRMLVDSTVWICSEPIINLSYSYLIYMDKVQWPIIYQDLQAYCFHETI